MKKRVITIILILVLLCIVAFVLVYTRPLTIEQRYPVLDISQCTQIRGYYYDGTDTENTPFTIYPDDPHFDEIVELFQSAAFETKLRNIFPQGTKTHPYSKGDFKWEVMFGFEDVLFPSGDMGSGDMLHIRNFFGDIDLSFGGEQVNCSVKNQEQWLKDVMNVITQYPDNTVWVDGVSFANLAPGSEAVRSEKIEVTSNTAEFLYHLTYTRSALTLEFGLRASDGTEYSREITGGSDQGVIETIPAGSYDLFVRNSGDYVKLPSYQDNSVSYDAIGAINYSILQR